MAMAVTFSKSIVGEIVRLAESRPYEVCGLLFGEPERVTGYLRCVNVAPDRERAFEIDPAALLAAHRRARAGGPAIVGCFHSHPGGPPVPSRRDAESAPPDGGLWLIAAGRGVGLYRAVERGELEGRFEAVRWTEGD